MHDVHSLLTDERSLVGGIRVPDGSEAAYLLGYADALDFALDLIAHRTDQVPGEELRTALRGAQLASTLGYGVPA